MRSAVNPDHNRAAAGQWSICGGLSSCFQTPLMVRGLPVDPSCLRIVSRSREDALSPGLRVGIKQTLFSVASTCHPTKHLCNICTTSAQRLWRWSDIVQMLHTSFVFTAWDAVSPPWTNRTTLGPDSDRSRVTKLILLSSASLMGTCSFNQHPVSQWYFNAGPPTSKTEKQHRSALKRGAVNSTP